MSERLGKLVNPRETCPVCRHLWRQHDPEDGMCDAHSDEPGVFGPCACGRGDRLQRERNAALARAALNEPSEGE